MKQTAVEWLVQQINSDCLNSTFISQDIFNQAKAMEKEQIFEAWNTGTYAYNNGQEYYKETYESNT